MTALIEKVELNPVDGEQTLLVAVLKDLLRKYQQRQQQQQHYDIR